MKRLILLPAALLLALASCAAPNGPQVTPEPSTVSVQVIRSAPTPAAASPEADGFAADDSAIDLLGYDDLPGGVPYTKTVGYASMTLVLPAGWKGVLVEPDDAGAFGIDFWREDSPENQLRLRYRPEQIGLCGTGLETENAAYGTVTASRMRYIDLSHWTLWIFKNTPGVYTIETDAPNNWIDTHAEELDGILGSLELGSGVIRSSEAEAIGRMQLQEDYEYCSASFDCLSGCYTLHFWNSSIYDSGETVIVDFAGAVIEE